MTPNTQSAVPALDPKAVEKFVSETWDKSIVPSITEYIAIPNKSPAFDKPDWKKNGAHAGDPHGDPRDGAHDDTVLLYGHLDKQPEMTGWREGLGPWKPVREGDKLYGRGGADDGYAAFASLTAIEALERQGPARALRGAHRGLRGERQLRPAGVHRHLAPRIGSPRWWCASTRAAATTTSSGSPPRCAASSAATCRSRCCARACTRATRAASCVELPHRCASCSRASRTRATGASSSPRRATSRCPRPAWRRRRPPRRRSATDLDKFPFVPGMKPMASDRVELALNRTWRPTLSVTAEGIPATASAGNVLRPRTVLRLSLRVPPTRRRRAARRSACSRLLEKDPPYGARSASRTRRRPGWNAPPIAPWLESAIDTRVADVLRQARRCTWARAARSRSWGCSAPSSPRRSS
jgi:hypothetical protein